MPLAESVIYGVRFHRFEFPRGRVIGDSQIWVDMHYIGAVELYTASGEYGLGFFVGLLSPLPSVADLSAIFNRDFGSALMGLSPFALTNRITRPRGGNIRGHFLSQAVDQAVWDLQAKLLGLPLYRLLGGTNPRVRAYASGLDYHMTDAEFSDFFRMTEQRGFKAFKIKVGHPDLAWDLKRLKLLVEAVGTDAILMVDANEAWSPKEAIRRLHAYRDAGFAIYWIEDPCLRDDFEGLRAIREAVPFSHINAGEYLDLHGKRQLIEQRAVDVLNIHGHISDSLRAAWLATDHGIGVALGNTPFELGVHIAAALPEPTWFEYSFQDYDHLIAQPIRFEDGYAIAPDRPGHGITLASIQDSEHESRHDSEAMLDGRKGDR